MRFGASLYARDFFRDLARLIGRSGVVRKPSDFQLLSRVATALPTPERLNFLLTLAREALVNGKFDAASVPATQALSDAPANSPETARAQLYLNAARFFVEGSDSALANLNGLRRLGPADATLLSAI